MRRRTLAVLAIVALVSSPAQAQVGRSQGIVDANTIADTTLAALPGMTPALAATVVAGRPYLSILRLDSTLAAGGLTPAQRSEIYRRTFIHVNLLTAPREEILLIPGAGPRMAREFAEYRPYEGGLPTFRREIRKYVDSAEVARLEQYVFLPINLNTATDEEILSIPGVGRRMLREFKEYRPYNDIARFRREIGKYVNAAEVSRLERYVRVN